MSRPRAAARLLGWCLIGGCLLATAACGYSTARLDDLGGGARTIAVVPFENQGFRRDLELRLTERVLEEVRARTSYGIAWPAQADYVLTGSMNANEAVALQREDRSVVQEQYVARAHVVLTDRRSGQIVREYDVEAVTEFTPDSGGESLLGSATSEVLRRLAIRIVQGLERGF
jgi:hypothetical protein